MVIITPHIYGQPLYVPLSSPFLTSQAGGKSAVLQIHQQLLAAGTASKNGGVGFKIQRNRKRWFFQQQTLVDLKD